MDFAIKTAGAVKETFEIPPSPDFVSRPVKIIEESPAIETGIPTDFAAIEQFAATKGTAVRLRQLQNKNTYRRIIGIITIAGVVAIIGGFVMLTPKSDVKNSSEKSQNSESMTAENSEANDVGSEEGQPDPNLTEFAKLGRPTNGKPINLQYIPFGTQVVLNLRPAALWKEESLGKEIRFCVPPLAKLIETTLDDLFKRKPEQVEELLICLIPGPRGTPPDIAAVAHMIEEEKRSQLIDQFGFRVDINSYPVYVSKNRVYMIPDLKTLVVCPKGQENEMVQAMKERHPAEQIDPLLPMTDRDRDVTLIFTPMTLNLQDSWFPENVRPLVRNVVEWLGDETETMAWSFNLTDDLFYSEILIRQLGVKSNDFERRFKGKLAKLAERLVSLIQQMEPKEVGKRMVIGRLPAMVEVFSMATIAHHGPHYAQFVTPLPDRAAPNLVLGAHLAWDESTRTDFTKAKPASSESSSVPALIADRLKTKIDVDFRAQPFNEAFAYIAGEIKATIDIDGDSLKLGGFTKNIKQEFRMDSARALDVIVKIFQVSKGVDPNPEKTLVLIVDESAKRILVTTLAGAGRKGLKPFEIK